jgi:endoglucanase
MKSLIQKLVEIPAPSGYETQMRAAVRAEIEPLADEVWVDNLGNLIARLGQPDRGGLKIMLAAHLDEIGIMATHIEENGFIRFMPVGAVFPRYCPGARVRFLNGAHGVIGLERLDEPNRMPGTEQMFVDLGFSRREDCPVKVGDAAVFERTFLDLGGRVVSKALDDRVGVAILIECLRQLRQDNLPHQVFFAFSVQEEVGTRGAATAAFGLDPDLGLAVDVTSSGDTPRGIRMEVGLGKGPAIKVRDAGTLVDPQVVSWMVKTAETEGIPYQLEVLETGWTDAKAIQLSRAGVPAGCISIPCRYVHSSSEMVDTGDLEGALRLLTALLRHANPLDA